MIREDLEHKLLSGGVIYIDDCPTYKVTLKDMADYGFKQIQDIISLMASNDSIASKFLSNAEGSMSTFYVLAIGIIQELRQATDGNGKKECVLYNSALAFLSMFFRQKVCFDERYGFVVKDESDNVVFVLNNENYDEFRKILRHRNCLADSNGVDDENPANEMAAKLLEKRRMLKEKIAKSRNAQDESGITMFDLISIFAEAEKMPLQDVYCNYDMYQFNNQFNRLRIMDDYHVNIQALMAGAKSEDIKLQHWISKINNTNNG